AEDPEPRDDHHRDAYSRAPLAPHHQGGRPRGPRDPSRLAGGQAPLPGDAREGPPGRVPAAHALAARRRHAEPPRRARRAASRSAASSSAPDPEDGRHPSLRRRLTLPRAVLVVTGSELVRGERTDLDGPFLAREVLALGLEPARILIVGDGEEELEAALRTGLDADLCITSGGLGPSPIVPSDGPACPSVLVGPERLGGRTD